MDNNAPDLSPLQRAALHRGLAMIYAIGCRARIEEPNGTIHGNLQVDAAKPSGLPPQAPIVDLLSHLAPPPPPPEPPAPARRKRADGTERQKRGTFSKAYKATMDAMEVGQCVVVPFDGIAVNKGDRSSLQSSMSSYAAEIWGKQSAITHMNDIGVEVLRVF